ncbi:putative ribonuclease H domain-containing protein [Arabidopsis thaliana]
MAMQHMWIRGHRYLFFEGDNSKILKLITGETRSFTLHNLIQEIRVWQQRFTSMKIQWIPRTSNKAVDCLTKTRRYNDVAFTNHFYVP